MLLPVKLNMNCCIVTALFIIRGDIAELSVTHGVPVVVKNDQLIFCEQFVIESVDWFRK